MVRRVTWMAMVVLALPALPAEAQVTFGIRAGASGNPDQFVVGAHVDTPPLIENLTFRPNVELGIGNDLTLVALNFEFAYWIPIPDQPWRVYLGAGPAANIISFGGGSGRGDDTDVEGGFNIMLGVQHSRGLFTELKVGVIDSPDIKVTVGWSFK